MTIAILNLQNAVPITPRLTATIKKLIRRTCRMEHCSCDTITVCFVDNRLMRMLHHKYLRDKTSTDVLAFEISGSSRSLTGDIVISGQMARTNAKVFKSTQANELCLYAVHGMLHLCGWRDKTKRERLAMQRRAAHIQAPYVHP